MKINCIIVDDEAFARKGLSEYVEDIDYLELVGTAENPVEAANLLQTHKVDLLFLDIQMPKMTGIDFLKILPQKPKTILTTAYSEYALQGYELNITDYLLKPISFERFKKACDKVKDELTNKTKITDANSYVFVKSDKKLERVIFEDILYIEALQNYIIIHCTNKKIITYLSLKEIEENLDPTLFIKIHKSYLVNITKIDSLTKEDILVGNNLLPIGRTFLDSLYNLIQSKIVKKN